MKTIEWKTLKDVKQNLVYAQLCCSPKKLGKWRRIQTWEVGKSGAYLWDTCSTHEINRCDIANKHSWHPKETTTKRTRSALPPFWQSNHSNAIQRVPDLRYERPKRQPWILNMNDATVELVQWRVWLSQLDSHVFHRTGMKKQVPYELPRWTRTRTSNILLEEDIVNLAENANATGDMQ